MVEQKGDKLLLVRVRDNVYWYLLGGKVEEGESPEEALVRELFEELRIKVKPNRIHYLYTVRGPAYGEEALVDLICFSAEFDGEMIPSAEISQVGWISLDKTEWFAPAVEELVKKYL